MFVVRIIFVFLCIYSQLWAQDAIELAQQLPDQSKVKQLLRNGLPEGLLDRESYKFHLQGIKKNLLGKNNNSDLIFDIKELGADLNWSTEEKLFELKLLMNFKGAQYNVSQLPRPREYGWDHWQFKVLPSESLLQSFATFNVDCGHQLRQGWCSKCRIGFNLQGLADTIYVAQRNKTDDLENQLNHKVFYCLFDIFWCTEYHIKKLADKIKWTKEQQKHELALLTQVLQKLQTGELIQGASENSQDKIEQECCICFEIGAVVLIPCGRHDKEDYIYHHQEKICTSCLKKLSQCPLCRRGWKKRNSFE